MLLRALKLITTVWLTLLVLVACGGGGSPSPAASGLKAIATESTVTVSWDMVSGVEYWIFYAPTSVVPASTASMGGWIGLPGGVSMINVTSPYVASGLTNGVSYSFSVNGRTGGGPGGPGTTPVTATPMLAGSTWSLGSATDARELRSAMFGSSYVAAGASGAMYSSTDGATWSAINYTTSSNLNGASYFGTYKLVGDAGLVLVSSDAVTWTAQTSGTTQNLYAVASNSINLTVAVGANGTIITSPDGITWSAAVTSPAISNALYGVTYSSATGTWVAVGAAGTVLRSTDGLNWTAVTSNVVTDLRGVTYGASAFVAVGSSGTVLSSADGSTWTSQVSPLAMDLKAVTYGTQLVAVGAGGNVMTSTDAVTWTASAATGTTSNLNAIVRGTLAYVSVGAAGTNLLAK